jgi:tRNA (cmo5U34)-methyltransferase
MEKRNMQKEHYLDKEKLSREYIQEQIEENSKNHELTCLVPKDDSSAEKILKENGFRYTGKRATNGQIMVVYKWFRDVKQEYEDMRSFFNRRAQDYDLHMSDGHENYEEDFVSLCKEIPQNDAKINIMDLGCGTGAELEAIFQKAPQTHVVCMDVAEKMLAILRETHTRYSKNIKTVCASYGEADFGDNTYDYMVACNTLHHLLAEEKLKLYAKIRKGLKDNGYLLILDYLAKNPEEEQSAREKYLALRKSGEISGTEIYHIDLMMTREHEVGLLEMAGFMCRTVEIINGNDIIISACSSKEIQ